MTNLIENVKLKIIPAPLGTQPKNSGFYLSRFALLSNFTATNWSDLISIVDQNLDQLNIENFCRFNNKLISISHTKNIAVVASCAHPNILGIGVDIEFHSRTMKFESHRYFMNDQEMKFVPDTKALMDFWIKKEAAFKSYRAIQCIAAPKLLKEIIFINENEYIYQNKKGQVFTLPNDFNLNLKLAIIDNN